MKLRGKIAFLAIVFSAASSFAQVVALSPGSTVGSTFDTINSNFLFLSTNGGEFVSTATTNLDMATYDITDIGDVTIAKNLTVSGFIDGTATSGIVADTEQTQGSGGLTSQVNEIATCANANDVVTLIPAIGGRSIIVINNGAQTLQVYPFTGDDLGAGVDASTTITAGGLKRFTAYDSTNWEPE